MKMSEFAKMDEVALLKTLAEKKAALARLTFSRASVPVKNVREMRVLKKDVARIKTRLHSLKSSVTK